MYTTPLSTLISFRSLNQQLYADDTQQFISFATKAFITAISQLQDTIAYISSYTTCNLLYLNLSKTEFSLRSLTFLNKYIKISNPSLSLPSNHTITPTDSARNLCFIFDSSLTFSKQISSLSSACTYHIRGLRRIMLTFDLKTACVIATSLVHSK